MNNTGFINYTWSPASGLNNPNIKDPIAYITQDIAYCVTASTAIGCEGTDSVSIHVFKASDLLVPNAFTPNGDGHNDVLRITPIGVREFKYFAVYDRWGRRVFYTMSPGAGWDGTINGNRQDTGTYVWIAAGTDYKGNRIERKGTVIVIR